MKKISGLVPMGGTGKKTLQNAVPVKGTIIGYARVSSDGQSLDAQLEQLRANGATKIFKEKVTGAKSVRVELQKALAALGKNDVLIVTRLDRLARSTLNLLHTLDQITAKGAGFKSLGDQWADTTTAHGRLMVTILGGLAEFERELILSRTSEGRARAVARGVKLGRKFKLSKHQREMAIKRRDSGKEQLSAIARDFNVAPSTISRMRL